jgi:hypothetical protein
MTTTATMISILRTPLIAATSRGNHEDRRSTTPDTANTSRPWTGEQDRGKTVVGDSQEIMIGQWGAECLHSYSPSLGAKEGFVIVIVYSNNRYYL